MKIRTILLMGGLVLLGACSESKYDLDQLVPEEYHKILYVNNSGKQDLTLYDTDEDNKYTLSVVKSGSDPSLTASVKVSVLTQAELDEEYSEPEGTNYKLIGENCYSLGATTLNEYQKYFEQDKALERRFQKVMIDEPDVMSMPMAMDRE